MFGFGLAVCSVAQIPTPWSQVRRLREPAAHARYELATAKALVARTTHRGEHVAILIPLGYRIAYELGLDNVTPYSGIEAMPTPAQLRRTLDAAQAAHVRSVFVSDRFTLQEQVEALASAGFAIAHKQREPEGIEYAQLVDAATLRR